MYRFRPLTALLFAAIVSPAAFLQDPGAASRPAAKNATLSAIAALAERTSMVQPLQEQLCVGIGPRLTGSTNVQKACEWAKQQFESFGLKASIEAWGEFPVGFDRGPSSARLLAPVEKNLEIGAMAWSAGTHGPAAGWVVNAPENAEAVASRPAQFKDRWVLRAASGRRGRGPVAGDGLTEALSKAGFLGYISSTGSELIHTDGNYRIQWDKLPTTPTVRIRKSDATEIANYLKEGKEVRIEVNLDHKFVKGPVVQNNVIAVLPGTTLPDEYVIVGGHIDSWDGAQGATDNGTGVVTTLEAARLITQLGLKPKRTILFMLWSGEEQGLLGSAGWIAKHRDMLAKISCVLVHDEGTNYCAGIQATANIQKLIEPALEPLFDLDAAMPFKIHPVASLPVGIGSDHDSFLMAGVPGFFWVQKGDVNYDFGHHTQHDVIGRVRYDYQKHSSIVIAFAAIQMANLESMIPRDGIGVRGGGGRRLQVQLDDTMKVESVVDDGPAAKAGVKAGDQLVKFNEKKITNRDELRAAIGELKNNSGTLVVLRDGKEISLKIEWPKQ
jgi:hypothetical protein